MERAKRPLYILLSLILSTGCNQDQPTAKDEIIDSFQIAEGFKIELIAMEPLISDPVAMEIDENGEIYVVEMHGYPLDTEGSGVVKKLYDDDGDGIMDRSQVFYDQLVLPTGIMKWKDGLLVTDPPDLLYLEDTDGDGQADQREVVLTGFALSNPQHNFNSPIYGLDNWIYLANESTYQSQEFGDLFGDKGGEIYFPQNPGGPRLPKNANDRNVKVDLNNHRLEMLSGESQFGHTFDQWGHHFTTTNWSHIYHEVLEAKYITRNDNLILPSALQYVPDYGIGFEIFPITHNPEHQLLTDVGAITSSCGITWYQGDLFPEPFQQVVLIAEPTHNLVHTDIVYNKGASFGSKQQFENREFLASTDGWFRPVNFYIGAAGELYLLDFYRKIIEHPEWISEEMLNSGELYDGIDQGRIYRISPEKSLSVDVSVALGQASTEELLPHLQNPNIWWRRHAQRLLVDQANQNSIPKIKEFLTTTDALGLLHGLWTLEGLDHFDKRLILRALDHAVPGIRENAIKIAELHRSEFPELEKQLIAMVKDPDSKVRFQLLCTLGYYQSEASAKARLDLLFQDVEDPWMQLAALSASSVNLLAIFQEAAAKLTEKQSTGTESLFTNLSKSIGKQGNTEEINRILEIITGKQTNTTTNWWRSAAMNGLAETTRPDHAIVKHHLDALGSFFAEDVDSDFRSGSLELLNALGYFDQSGPLVSKAKSVAVNSGFDARYRADAIKILAWVEADDNVGLFQSFLSSDEPAEVKSSAIQALGNTTGIEVCQQLVAQWNTMTPTDRGQAITVFLTNDERKMILLEAVEANQIQASTIGWRRTVSLLNSHNQQIRDLARSVLEGNETISDSVWVGYQKVLTLKGNPINGAEIYDQSCGICHQISGGNGTAYGPDLAAIRNRNKAGIMIDILKPNRSISDGFDLWTIQDKLDNYYSGIIADESINSLTLRNAAGEDILIQKSEIHSKTAAEISAMPEGLHRQISQQGMADLLEFLKNGK